MNELYHHGIKGQKWGVRRFQNPDGSYTKAGLKRKQLLDQAADKASKFSKYARDDYDTFSKMKEANTANVKHKNYKAAYADNRKATEKDIDRWMEVSKKGEKYYSSLAKEYQNKDVSSVSRKDLKEAKDFVDKAFFVNADFADYYVNGNEIRNYLYNDYSNSDRKGR